MERRDDDDDDDEINLLQIMMTDMVTLDGLVLNQEVLIHNGIKTGRQQFVNIWKMKILIWDNLVLRDKQSL